MIQELFRCVVCNADFDTPGELRRHTCPAKAKRQHEPTGP